MVEKIILITLFLITSCGKDVSLSTKSLEFNSGLSDGASSVTNQEGILKRGNPDKISINGAEVKISTYSSYQALEFVAIRPLNSQTNIKFRAKNKNNEILLEYIEAK